MDAKQVLEKLAKENGCVSAIACISNIGSQRWAGMIVGFTGKRDGNSLYVKVLKSSPAFPSWTVGRIGPMALSYYNAMGGQIEKVGRKGAENRTEYSLDEIFSALPVTQTASEQTRNH